jgi:hypothetical protein
MTTEELNSGFIYGESPESSKVNWLQQLVNDKINYLLSQGVPSWNVDTVYSIGSFVSYVDGTEPAIYIALEGSQGIAPRSNPNVWEVLAGTSLSSQVAKNTVDIETINDTSIPQLQTAIDDTNTVLTAYENSQYVLSTSASYFSNTHLIIYTMTGVIDTIPVQGKIYNIHLSTPSALPQNIADIITGMNISWGGTTYQINTTGNSLANLFLLINNATSCQVTFTTVNGTNYANILYSSNNLLRRGSYYNIWQINALIQDNVATPTMICSLQFKDLTSMNNLLIGISSIFMNSYGSTWNGTTYDKVQRNTNCYLKNTGLYTQHIQSITTLSGTMMNTSLNNLFMAFINDVGHAVEGGLFMTGDKNNYIIYIYALSAGNTTNPLLMNMTLEFDKYFQSLYGLPTITWGTPTGSYAFTPVKLQ